MTSDQTTPDQPDDKGSDESREPILEIYLIPKMPEYGLEVMQPGTDDARMMVDVRHSLSTSHDSGYAVFANMINIRNLVSEDGEKPKALAMLKNETGGDFTLGINFEIFRRLSHSAKRDPEGADAPYTVRAVQRSIQTTHQSVRIGNRYACSAIGNESIDRLCDPCRGEHCSTGSGDVGV